MTDLLHSTIALVASFGPLGVFFASVLEEVIVVIPSSLIQLAAGFFLVANTPFSFLGFGKVAAMVAFPAALGVTLGSLLVYYLAYFGGEPAVRKWGKWFFLRWNQIERFRERLLERKITFWFFVFLKFMPAIPSAVVTGFCGAIKMPIGRYMGITFLGVFIRAFMLGTLGWLAGDLYGKIVAGFDQLEGIGTIIVAMLLAGGVGYFYSYAKKRTATKNKKI